MALSYKSKISPTLANISWDRVGPEPELSGFFIVFSGDNAVDFVQYQINFENTGVQWLYAPGLSGSYLEHDGSSAVLPLAVKNLDQLPAGNYKANIIIELSNAENYRETLFATVNLSLTGSIVPAISTDKKTYTVTFNRATNSLSGDTVVNILNNGEGKLLSLSQPSTLFQPKSGFTGSFTIEDNSTAPLALNTFLPEAGTVSHACKIVGSAGEQVVEFTIDLVLLNNGGIGVNPGQLFFEVIKNTTEKTNIVSIVNPAGMDFTIQTPAWLTASVLSGNTSLNIEITTNTAILEVGTYNDVIKVIFAGGIIDIPVEMILKQFVTITPAPHYFCLDMVPLLFTKINDDARYVKITIKATFVVMGTETYFENEYVVPYVDHRAAFQLGQKLHQYFPRHRDHLFDIADSVEFLKAIDCDLILEELDKDYESVLAENLDNLKFYPGSAPKMFPIFSNYEHRKKNPGSVLFFTHANDESVTTERIDETRWLSALTYENKTVQLYQYPQAFLPIHVQFENQNLVPEWFTFTGEYSIDPDFTHISSRNILNSLMEKFETSEIQKLKVNTGFFLKQEIDIIYDIIKSRLAFIKIGTKVYQCYSVTPKLTLDSSSQTLIERDLEFIIVG